MIRAAGRVNVAILTISDSRTQETDTSGKYLARVVAEAGHLCVARNLVIDDVYQIRAVISAWIADPAIDALITTGGTGFSRRDSTPEAVSPLFDKPMPGFGEIFRNISYEEIGSSTMQSRALGGFANGTVVFCLPGSTGACKTAWNVLIRDQLDYSNQPCNFFGMFKR